MIIARDRKTLEEVLDNQLAPYAIKNSLHWRSKDTARETYRTNYRRDRDKILYSLAFRRLQSKAQVFVSVIGEHNNTQKKFAHYRNRLSHTLEVDQIAYSIANALGLNLDLVSAIAMGHDIGHTPFGHAGERALNKSLRSSDEKHGGFLHSLQSVRYLHILSNRAEDQSDLKEVDKYVKLGVLKHDTDIINCKKEDIEKQFNIFKEIGLTDDEVYCPSFLEAQTVYWADKIAYLCHDWDDFVTSNLLKNAITNQDLYNDDITRYFEEMFRSVDSLKDRKIKSLADIKMRDIVYCICTKIIEDSAERLSKQSPKNFEDAILICKDKYSKNLKELLLKNEATTNEDKFLNDIIKNNYSIKPRDKHLPFSDDTVFKKYNTLDQFLDNTDHRFLLNSNNYELKLLKKEDKTEKYKLFKKLKKDAYQSSFLIGFNENFSNHINKISKLISDHFCKSPEVALMDKKGNEVLMCLYSEYSQDQKLLPLKTQKIISNGNVKERVITDHLAGMTDSYACKMYNDLKTTHWGG